MFTPNIFVSTIMLTLIAGQAAAVEPASRDRPAGYTVMEISAPPEIETLCAPGMQRQYYARRLNEQPEVVGHIVCFTPSGDPEAPYAMMIYAFRWTQSSGTTLMPIVGTEPRNLLARDINESGTVVGWESGPSGYNAPVWPAAGGGSYAFEAAACGWRNSITRADAVNDLGTIVGESWREDETGECNRQWVARLPDGQVVIGPVGYTPYQINNNNVVAGVGPAQVIKWSVFEGTVVLAEAAESWVAQPFAWGINAHDEVVGNWKYLDEAGCVASSDAVIWAADGTQNTLPALAGYPLNTAVSINEHSTVVGYAQMPTANCGEEDPTHFRAVRWRSGKAKDLNMLVAPEISAVVQLFYATAINDHGQILVRGIRPGEPQLPCPMWLADPTVGQYYDGSLMCHNEYSFVLTPIRN